MRESRQLLFVLVTALARLGSASAQAPLAQGGSPASSSRATAVWAASSVLLATAFVFDERLRDVALANQSRELDRLAAGADLLGTAGHIVPALVTAYVVARVTRRTSFAAATLRVGLSYAAADAVASLLKPAVGRVRPYEGREPLTFQPFTHSGDFHSFPSAHVVHVASLASAVAIEGHRPWVALLAGAATVYVGMQRVYRDQHWTSDVVASGLLGVEIARTTEHWLVDGSR